jgi:hypothetical protein
LTCFLSVTGGAASGRECLPLNYANLGGNKLVLYVINNSKSLFRQVVSSTERCYDYIASKRPKRVPAATIHPTPTKKPALTIETPPTGAGGLDSVRLTHRILSPLALLNIIDLPIIEFGP